jgi:hypothetical protein
MADDTQNSGLPAGLTPGLFTILKQATGKSDQEVITGYKQASDAAAAEGADLSSVPEDKQAAFFMQLLGAAKNGQQIMKPVDEVPKTPPPTMRQTMENPVNAPGTVPKVVPGTPAPQVPLANVQDSLYTTPGGTADRLAYSDPKAYLEQAKAAALRNVQDPVGRGLSAIGAAYAQGLGGQAGAVEANAKRNREEDMAYANAIKNAQDMANQGLGAANEVAKTQSSVGKEQAQLQMEKEKFITDQRKNNVSAEQAEVAWNSVGKNLYDASSTSSVLSQRLAEQAMGLKAGALDGHSAAQIAAEVQGVKPATELQKQYYDQLIAKINADSQRMTAVAGANLSNAQAGQVKTGTNLTTEATGVGPTGVVNPEKADKVLGGQGGTTVTIGPGGASIGPSASNVANQNAGSDTLKKQREAITSYNNAGVGVAVDTALKKLGPGSLKDTGKIGDFLSKASPTDAAGIKSALINYYTSQGQDPKTAQASAQNIFDMTPMRATQALAQIKAAQMQTRVHLDSNERYAAANGGSLVGAPIPQISYYYNPKPIQTKDGKIISAGDVIMNSNPNEAPPAGYIPLASGGR